MPLSVGRICLTHTHTHTHTHTRTHAHTHTRTHTHTHTHTHTTRTFLRTEAGPHGVPISGSNWRNRPSVYVSLKIQVYIYSRLETIGRFVFIFPAVILYYKRNQLLDTVTVRGFNYPEANQSVYFVTVKICQACSTRLINIREQGVWWVYEPNFLVKRSWLSSTRGYCFLEITSLCPGIGISLCDCNNTSQ